MRQRERGGGGRDRQRERERERDLCLDSSGSEYMCITQFPPFFKIYLQTENTYGFGQNYAQNVLS